MSSAELVLLAVTFAAALVQATIGVGFALVMAPLAAVLRPDLLPGALILLMIPLNAVVAWREREALDSWGTGWITAGRVVGAVLGLWVLTLLSARGLAYLIGGSTIAAVAASVLAPDFRPGRTAFAGAGLVTGVTETATGIGGPPLALVFQHQPPPVLRANVAMCFLVGEVMSVALLAAAGSLGREQVIAAAAGLPPLALGLGLSGAARRRLDTSWLRRIVLGFALVSSVITIARA